METQRPGGAVPRSDLYELRVVQGSNKQVGFYTPERVYYPFNNGEQFIQIRLDEGSAERTTYIHLVNDTLIPVDLWISQQS